MRSPAGCARGWAPSQRSWSRCFQFMVACALVRAAELLLEESPLTLLQEVPALANEPQRIAGYFDLNSTRAGRMFYWFFESRTMQSTDPLVLWINGGPGLSSTLSVFYENGPYRLDDDLDVRLAPWSWDVNHNIIYVDQPINTGFSYSTDERDTVYTEAQLAEDVVSFLGEFLEEHPDMASIDGSDASGSGGKPRRDFYLAGVSYAGHMVPNIAAALLRSDAGRALPLRLVGVSLGNPLVAPAAQYRYHGRYAESQGLVDAGARREIDEEGYAPCRAVIDTCVELGSRDYCGKGVNVCSVNTVGAVLKLNPGMNVYDVRKACDGPLCYDYSPLSEWLERDDVRAALGVSRPWAGPASEDAHAALLGDWLLPYDALVGSLLDAGLRVLVYAGKYDQLCNWIGQEAWLDALDWGGAQGFKKAGHANWTVGGRSAGTIRSSGPLSFVVVDDAGHYAPMDAPEQMWHLFSRFTRDVELADDSGAASYMPPGPAARDALEPPASAEVAVADGADSGTVTASIGISGR